MTYGCTENYCPREKTSKEEKESRKEDMNLHNAAFSIDNCHNTIVKYEKLLVDVKTKSSELPGLKAQITSQLNACNQLLKNLDDLLKSNQPMFDTTRDLINKVKADNDKFTKDYNPSLSQARLNETAKKQYESSQKARAEEAARKTKAEEAARKAKAEDSFKKHSESAHKAKAEEAARKAKFEDSFKKHSESTQKAKAEEAARKAKFEDNLKKQYESAQKAKAEEAAKKTQAEEAAKKAKIDEDASFSPKPQEVKKTEFPDGSKVIHPDNANIFHMKALYNAPDTIFLDGFHRGSSRIDLKKVDSSSHTYHHKFKVTAFSDNHCDATFCHATPKGIFIDIVTLAGEQLQISDFIN